MRVFLHFALGIGRFEGTVRLRGQIIGGVAWGGVGSGVLGVVQLYLPPFLSLAQCKHSALRSGAAAGRGSSPGFHSSLCISTLLLRLYAVFISVYTL